MIARRWEQNKLANFPSRCDVFPPNLPSCISVRVWSERDLPCVERRGSGALRRQRSGAALCSTNGTGRGTNMIRRCAWLHSFLPSVFLPSPPLLLWLILSALLFWYIDLVSCASTGFFTPSYFWYCAFVSSLHRCARAGVLLWRGLSWRRAYRQLGSIEQLVIYAIEGIEWSGEHPYTLPFRWTFTFGVVSRELPCRYPSAQVCRETDRCRCVVEVSKNCKL